MKHAKQKAEWALIKMLKQLLLMENVNWLLTSILPKDVEGVNVALVQKLLVSIIANCLYMDSQTLTEDDQS